MTSRVFGFPDLEMALMLSDALVPIHAGDGGARRFYNCTVSNNTSSNGPPTFPEEIQLDGTNFVHFENRVMIAAQARGARGYLEGEILKPEPVKAPPMDEKPAETTAWTSRNPSAEEWDLRDAWTLGLIIYNCRNPVGLGIKTDSTAGQAWTSLTKVYRAVSDLTAMGAENAL
ncbi:hypothetical protein C0989_011783 [Termitomyces sp. Mn162]|nr:hypothetical protein C0989_011783 [Termitomyces sp. Mn162]